MKKKEKQGALAAVIIIIAVAAVVVYAFISAKPPTWQTDNRLSSNGIQETTAFTMNNTWRVVWMINQTDQMFILAVYMQNSTGAYSLVVDTTEMPANSTEGILPIYSTGTFVMRVIASDNTQWVLLIQERKTA